ncbi:MAG TPA: hypothetical protein VM889_08495 [Candidatus Thermoplasmatota archaeon]|nr:hypothetical protein [Candidatus Thermoplasmatota archaeon]
MRIPTFALTGLLLSLAFAGCIGNPEKPGATDDGGLEPADALAAVPQNFTFDGNTGAFACGFTPVAGRCVPILPSNNGVTSKGENDTAGNVTVTATWKAVATYTEEMYVGIFRLKSNCGSKCSDKDLDEVQYLKGKSPLTVSGKVNGLYGVFVWKNECVPVACVRPVDQPFKLEYAVEPYWTAADMEHGHKH